MPNKITLPASRTVKIYYVKPDKKTEFLDFCGVVGKNAKGEPVFKGNGEPFKGIRDWLIN
jgi:hypothetical protein